VILPLADDLSISTLGPCRIRSPLARREEPFVNETRRILVCCDTQELQPFLDSRQSPPAFEAAGPRSQLFFDPQALTCGIVTCGGICPGINDVIRSLVLTATHAYGVRGILGFRYGYAGLASNTTNQPFLLTPDIVDRIHQHGGTLLGSSRGPQDVRDMVGTLVKQGVRVLFAIGGDGTLRGALALSEEIARRNLAISIICIPKTIDNDLQWTEQSFGFNTAVEEAAKVIAGAHIEAHGAWNGIGLVKLMGRHSGFIAAHASLANSDVNFCLVPEVAFTLEGEHGFLQALERRLQRKHHAVIVVAEGTGQEMLQNADEPMPQQRDASGNLRLQDVGIFLRERITRHLADRSVPTTIRYIDPSYVIRSLPANAFDSKFCLMLGQHAVHAAMAGRTKMTVGYWNQHFTHVSTALVVTRRKQLDPQKEIWQSVLQSTGQPFSLGGK
jgi:6-phosphofructokinase 1